MDEGRRCGVCGQSGSCRAQSPRPRHQCDGKHETRHGSPDRGYSQAPTGESRDRTDGGGTGASSPAGTGRTYRFPE